MRILILGGGQVGALIARRLARENNEVALVEMDQERCIELEESLDIRVVRGNASSIETLKHRCGSLHVQRRTGPWDDRPL